VEIIQAVLDTQLLKASDRAAKRQRINRSALFDRPCANIYGVCVCWTSRNETGAVIKLGRSALKSIFLGRRWRVGRKIEQW
jgi:hypothetical protein